MNKTMHTESPVRSGHETGSAEIEKNYEYEDSGSF